jgi:hypothetical protein
MWDFRFWLRRAWSLVFWNISPCSHVEVDRRFRGAYCLHHQGDSVIVLIMEAVRTSETSVNFNLNTRRYIPEDSKLRSEVQFQKCLQRTRDYVEKSTKFVSSLSNNSFKAQQILLSVVTCNTKYLLWDFKFSWQRIWKQSLQSNGAA